MHFYLKNVIIYYEIAKVATSLFKINFYNMLKFNV